jgi:hypothetical protein
MKYELNARMESQTDEVEEFDADPVTDLDEPFGVRHDIRS